MLHHKYAAVSEIHPPPARPPRRMGGWGAVNAPYVTLNLYFQMKSQVPHSHEFGTLAPPPLHSANSLFFQENKMKGHAHQNNNNINYDDETGKDSEKKKIVTHQELNSFIVIARATKGYRSSYISNMLMCS